MATPKFQREDFFQAAPGDNSAAQVASGLASALQSFSNQAFGVAKGMSDQRKAAEQISIDSAAIDIGEQIAYAKGLNPDNLENFTMLAEKSANGTLSAMPKNLRARTQAKVHQEYASAITAVKLGQHKRYIEEGVVEATTSIETVNTLGANAARDGNFEEVAAARENLNGVLSPQLFTPGEIQAKLTAFDKEMSEQAVIGTALKISADKGSIAAFQSIQDFEEQGVDGTSPDEVSRIANEARGILNTQMTLSDKTAAQSDKDTKKWQEANTEVFLLAASGATGQSDQEVLIEAREAWASRKITHKQFLAVKKEIEAPNGSDFTEVKQEIIGRIYDNYSKDEVEQLIVEARDNGQLTPGTALELRQQNIARSGLPPTDFDLRRDQAFKFLKTTLEDTSIFAKYNPDRNAKFALAMDEYNVTISSQGEAVDPMAIAKDIASRSKSSPLTVEAFHNPRYGDKNNLDNATDLTLDAFDNGEISIEESDFQMALIEQIREAQSMKKSGALNVDSLQGKLDAQ